MQAHHAAAAAIGLALVGGLAPPGAAQQQARVAVCPSSDKAQQVIQNPGAPLPDGCRIVVVIRQGSPAGPLCAVDFGQADQGLFGDLVDAAVPTRWWTACANLQSP